MQPPNKYDPVHIILMGAAPLFSILAAKWPQYWPAFGAALLLAYYVAIWTHKPGAAKVIAELQEDAKNVKTTVEVIDNTKGSAS